MRLTCPNCAAQYELPDTAIPEAGREVQCSACDKTWLQHAAGAAPTSAAHAPPVSEEAGPPSSSPQPAPRSLDPGVADILRTEAAREKAKRAAESTGSVATRAEPALSGATSGTRSGTLPDPDDITSSLTPSRDRVAQDRLDARDARFIPPERRGFRAGFWMALIACGLAVGVYLAAFDLVDLVPEAEAPIERYVTSIDDARLRLDALFDEVMTRINGG